MTLLNPRMLLEDNGIRLTRENKIEILSKMHPPAANGIRYADAIFEGGGVRGIAFLGALRCCHDLGLQWRKLAGTSAGAITAAFLSANLTIGRLEQILGELNYMEFLTEKTSPLILNGDPRNDLQTPVQMISSLLLSRQIGQYSSIPFRNWLDRVLNLGQVRTFADLKKQGSDHDLKVVVSDISRGEMVVLPDDLNPDLEILSNQQKADREAILKFYHLSHYLEFSIAEAVRLSMSIPLFFEPGKLGQNLIVDGGILSNFPLWIYDIQPQPGQAIAPPRCPTFGFRLIDRFSSNHSDVKGPLDVLAATVRTMMKARDSYHLREVDRGRVINIDVTEANVTPTQFNLSSEEKIKLYQLGYQQTKEFFLYHWNWTEHLKRRGFLSVSENRSISLDTPFKTYPGII